MFGRKRTVGVIGTKEKRKAGIGTKLLFASLLLIFLYSIITHIV